MTALDFEEFVSVFRTRTAARLTEFERVLDDVAKDIEQRARSASSRETYPASARARPDSTREKHTGQGGSQSSSYTQKRYSRQDCGQNLRQHGRRERGQDPMLSRSQDPMLSRGQDPMLRRGHIQGVLTES